MKRVCILALALITFFLHACTDDGDTLDNSVSILPQLTTDSASDITNNSATCGGKVISTGLSYVSARGVCWSLVDTPTIDDQKTLNGSGIGTFSSNMTGLYSGMQYYVRAYASSPQGTAYGNLVTFRTTGVPTITLPVVVTITPSGITGNSCNGGGNIITDGGLSITARGVCWSLSPGPAISGSKTSDGTGSGLYASSVSGLIADTTYYIRAYATNLLGTAYGNEISFRTTP